MRVKKLVKKAQRGNKEALLELIMAQQHDYYRLANTYVGNEADALDAMENMIVILHEKIGQLERLESFYSWSKTILVNECRAILRKRKNLVFIEDEQLIEETVDPFEAVDLSLTLKESLDALNPVQKEAIQLKYFLDYDYRTIATLTNVSVGTAKSRVFTALKKLRHYFGGDET